MKHSERFALSQWLSDYPNDEAYDTVLDLLLTDSDRVTVWGLVDHMPTETVYSFIEDTRIAFERKVDDMTVFCLSDLNEGEKI